MHMSEILSDQVIRRAWLELYGEGTAKLVIEPAVGTWQVTVVQAYTRLSLPLHSFSSPVHAREVLALLVDVLRRNELRTCGACYEPEVFPGEDHCGNCGAKVAPPVLHHQRGGPARPLRRVRRGARARALCALARRGRPRCASARTGSPEAARPRRGRIFTGRPRLRARHSP